MANKKCPKCGEDNPAEAVMCWACYTPLTAGAGASMGAGVGGAGAATMPRPGGAMGGMTGAAEGEEKKKTDPKIFFVAGGLLFAALIGLWEAGFIGGAAPDTGPNPIDTGSSSSSGRGDRPTTSGGVIVSVPAPPPPSPGGNTTTTTSDQTGQTQTQFSTIVSPNPKFTTATLALAPSQPATEQEAIDAAQSARQTMGANGKWKDWQIVVFADNKSSQAFSSYMNARRGEPLSGNDFATLAQQHAWDNATIFYESQGKGGKGNILRPSKNPNGWWARSN